MSGQTEIAIIGAGIAGLAAAHVLSQRGIPYTLLEASHRVGGRAYTEDPVPGLPLDLGCHWLHSGSVNPLVPIADALGFDYDTSSAGRAVFRDGAWLGPEVLADLEAHEKNDADRIARRVAIGGDAPLLDVRARSDIWSPLIDYETSLFMSADPDEVSTVDYANACNTGEDWPVREGLGALIATYAQALPVVLNAAVQSVDWSGKRVRLTTPCGTVEADKVILTVSTGILASGDIRFHPALPAWKSEAISRLPLGNHNRIYLMFDRDVFGSDAPDYVTILGDDNEAMGFLIKPFGRMYVHAMTGGRLADWLERAGSDTAVDVAMTALTSAFGHNIADHLTGRLVTAWRGDSWTKGAYSVAEPGCSDQRERLGEPIDERLFFAGEAVSRSHFSTAHGAYMSGVAAAERVAGDVV